VNSAAVARTTTISAPRFSLRQHRYDILLAASVLAGVVGILKGFSETVEPDAEFYWLFTYAHGFVKRGLIGTIVSPLATRVSIAQLRPLIAGAHAVACVSIVLILHRLFRGAAIAERRADSSLALVLSFLCLMCTEMMPVLAHDTGSVDVYLVALVLIGASLVLRGRYAAAVAVALVGPLIHEAFVLAWAPLTIMLVYSSISSSEQRRMKIAAAVVPVIAGAIVNSAHSPQAVARLMDAWAASGAIKTSHEVYTFGQTLRSSFAHMRDYEFHGHWSNFATAVAFFMVPNALLLWTAVFCYSRRWMRPRTTPLVAIAAMLSPLTAVVLAWDLSRFLVWSTVAAAVALLAAGSPTLTRMQDEGV